MIARKTLLFGTIVGLCITGQSALAQQGGTRGATGERMGMDQPMDQPSTGEERSGLTAQNEPMDSQRTDLIARVRSDVVADDSLSTMAHNVAILSSGRNSVILRGKVRNNAEKQRLVEIARRHAGQVTDETTVDRG